MTQPPFIVHTPQTASQEARATLAYIGEKLDFVPNMFAVMGGAPAALTALAEVNRCLTRSSLTPLEAEIIQIAASVGNTSPYCVAGHTAFAAMQHLDADVIDAVRNEQRLPDVKLEALRWFTHRLVESRGHLDDRELVVFVDAGYSQNQAIEVIMAVSLKFFTNLTSNLTGIALDEAFAAFEWKSVGHTVVAR